VERTEVLGREMGDVVKDFDAWIAKELSDINAALVKKKLEPIRPLTREEWEKSE
jgi:hypothetical protein